MPLITVGAGTAADTARLLVARQRELAALLTNEERAKASEYLEMSLFTPQGSYTRARMGTGKVEQVDGPPGAGYLALLNGSVPAALLADPSKYTVRRIAPELAVVTTAPDRRGARLAVVWHLRPDGWRVTRMDVLLADSARRPRHGPFR